MSLQSEIRQGERDAKAKQAASRRAAKLASSGRIRRTGRAAVRVAKKRGKGIVIKSQKVSHAGRGLVNYATQEKKGHELVFSNCGSPENAIRAMERAAGIRPDIKQPVAHITLSLPPGVGKSEKRWAEIVEKTRAELDIGDEFPCFVVRHSDTEHDHVHLIFSRVSVDGRVHDQANIGLRCAATERVIEHHFGLRLFKSAPKSAVPLSKPEIEKALRLKQQPPRMQLHEAISEALKDRPTPQVFIERLQLAGVSIRANVASTGKVSGLAFAVDGISFGGSKIHKDYGWASLQKGLNYVETRDREFITRLNAGASPGGIDLAAASSRIVGLVGSTTPTNRAASKPRAGDRASRTPSPNAPAPEISPGPAAPDATPTSAAPAGETTTAAKDDLEKIYRSGLDSISPDPKPKPATTKEIKNEQSTTRTTTNPAAGLDSRPAARKDFGGFKRRTGARGLRPLSQVPVASHLSADVVLLRRNGVNHLADGRNEGQRGNRLRLSPTASGRAKRIAPPNLSQPDWQRSSVLLQSYRDALKGDPDAVLADLHAEAMEAGHAAPDVINAHATISNVPHAEAALKVAEASPTPEVLEHVESEYRQAAKRSASRLTHNLDPEAPKPPAPK